MALAGVGAVSRVAPAAAAWLAERLFLRRPRYPPPDRERAILARAQPDAIRVDGRRIATWTWGAGPAVALVHGLAEMPATPAALW
jgi:hypothetical protein